MYGPLVQGSFFFFVYQLFLAATAATSHLLGRLSTTDIVDAEEKTSRLVYNVSEL
jgi:hypothetical protein